mmetsp:Transcript_5833/g.14213  ORF Transcript_5833/g.14213 Transcript_5833/m.14213 type:complete len:214 (-) Transcript_5833:584-1225(-)
MAARPPTSVPSARSSDFRRRSPCIFSLQLTQVMSAQMPYPCENWRMMCPSRTNTAERHTETALRTAQLTLPAATRRASSLETSFWRLALRVTSASISATAALTDLPWSFWLVPAATARRLASLSSTASVRARVASFDSGGDGFTTPRLRFATQRVTSRERRFLAVFVGDRRTAIPDLQREALENMYFTLEECLQNLFPLFFSQALQVHRCSPC